MNDYFLSNGGFTPESLIKGVDGGLTNISTFDIETSTLHSWGIGQPGLHVKRQSGSWAYSLLPFLEQQAAYDEISVEFQPSFYLCASRARGRSQPTIDDMYGIYTSGGLAWGKTDYAGNENLFRPIGSPIQSRYVRDGLSNTIMFGEKAFNSLVETALDLNQAFAEPFFA